jgi:hypothetical protein
MIYTVSRESVTKWSQSAAPNHGTQDSRHVSLSEQTYNQVARFGDVKDLYKYQNNAIAARELAKQAKEPKILWNYCMADATWARWKIGRLIPKIINSEGGRPSENTPTLGEFGIEDDHESTRWQLLARIDEYILPRRARRPAMPYVSVPIKVLVPRDPPEPEPCEDEQEGTGENIAG